MPSIVVATRRHLRLLLRSERGMALPTAMLATVASLGLAGAAVMSSVDVQQGTQRDSDSKSAIAAADAGANVARLRLNRYASSLSSEKPCLNVNMAGMLEPGPAPAGSSWCAPIEGTVGAATYSYQATAVGAGGCAAYDLCVVATGFADEVSRRIQVAFDEQGPASEETSEENEETSEEETQEEKEEKELEEKEEAEGKKSGGIEGLIGVDSIEIDNNADARVSIGTNGDVYVHNNGNVCGSIRHGIGKKATFQNNGTQCSGYKIREGNVTVTPVSSFIPSNIATVNSNYRLAQCTKTKPTPTPTGCQSDTYSKSWSSTTPWNPSTRTISTSNNATLTLGGGDYFVCRLLLSNNSHLIMADGAKVRVFFDTPENCKLSAGTKQIDVSNNANITSTGYQPEIGEYDVPGFYLLGSDTISTKVEWSNNSGTNEFVLYAPKSDIELRNNAIFYGVIVGKTVHLQNNAIVIQDAGFMPPPEIVPPQEDEGEEEEEEGSEEEESSEEETTEEEESATNGVRYFTPQSYVECSGDATSTTPDANC